MSHLPSLQTLRAFEAAGRHKSYSKAAEELGLTHGAVSHPPAADTPRRVALAGAEAGLLVLALGVAASFTRLFVDWGWLGRLAVPVVAAWAASLITRRVGLGVGPPE